VLAELGLDSGFFEEPENRLFYRSGGRLVTRWVEASGCPYYGLRVGQRAGLAAMGAVGYLVQSAPSVRAALDALAQHLQVHDSGGLVDVEVDGTFASLGYTVVQHGVDGVDQIQDLSMAVAVNILRALCGSDWVPTEVVFAHRRPVEPEPFRQFFRCPIRFDAERTAVVFRRELLGQPPLGADPLLHRLMTDLIRELEARAKPDWVGSLRPLLRTMVVSPDCSLSALAKRVGVHSRTLNRRLGDAGTSFLQLREEVRYTVARQLLENTTSSTAQIASRLGYADSSSFCRAFKRWSGTGPAKWRSAHATDRAGRSGTIPGYLDSD